MSWKWIPKMIHCADCGSETLATHNKTKYCPDCAKRRDKESRKKSKERIMSKKLDEKSEEPLHFCDSPENVQKCLNCEKPVCVNCLCSGTQTKKKNARHVVSEEVMEKVAECVRDGMKQKDIAIKLGVSPPTVSRWISWLRWDGVL